MCGFTYGASYSLFITDMVSVWSDAPTAEKIYKKALDRGITDFDEDKLQFLKSNLAMAFCESVSDILFSSTSSSVITAEVKVSEYLSWSFDAEICDTKITSDFFRALCCQSFSNNSLSLYREFLLESMIRTRDKYILYLEENYKTVNGTELMDKYRRQHPEAAKQLQKYSKEDFDSNLGSSYSEYLKKTTTEDPQSRVWKEFTVMAKHQHEWVKSAEKARGLSEHQLTNVPKGSSSDNLPTNVKKRRGSQPEDDHERKSRIKIEHEDGLKLTPEQSSSTTKKLSPAKRKRLGLVGKR
ncbi:hypothetical protein JCM33374_g833 [Metschnikowia sp. JCM 33374]|nr:hypothetical protein JCM33374_g833 [Metschnikowia sp. JCM 33374]